MTEEEGMIILILIDYAKFLEEFEELAEEVNWGWEYIERLSYLRFDVWRITNSIERGEYHD